MDRIKKGYGFLVKDIGNTVEIIVAQLSANINLRVRLFCILFEIHI